jgi:hypothetical protein
MQDGEKALQKMASKKRSILSRINTATFQSSTKVVSEEQLFAQLLKSFQGCWVAVWLPCLRSYDLMLISVSFRHVMYTSLEPWTVCAAIRVSRSLLRVAMSAMVRTLANDSLSCIPRLGITRSMGIADVRSLLNFGQWHRGSKDFCSKDPILGWKKKRQEALVLVLRLLTIGHD